MRKSPVDFLIFFDYDAGQFFSPIFSYEKLKKYVKIKEKQRRKNKLIDTIQIYCDGACSGNPGYGGWAFVVIDNDEIIDFGTEYNPTTTNNRMELVSLREALNWIITNKAENVIIYSDSTYVVNTFNDWMYRWQARGWVRGQDKEVKNLDIIQQLYDISIAKVLFSCSVEKVSGHIGIYGNEVADALASGNRNKLNKIIKEQDRKKFIERGVL